MEPMSTSSSIAGARTEPDRLRACPACGQRDALLALGIRYGHPHRWRPWVTVLTPLYLCESCEALVAVGPAQHRAVDTLSPPGRPAAADTRRPGLTSALA
jgi:hypothetical protein